MQYYLLQWQFRFSPVLQTIFLIRSVYVKSQSIASTSNRIFWWALQTQTEWVILEPARTHHFSLKAQNFVDPIFTFVCFSLKAVYNSCNLQRLLQVAKFLIIYSFTHTNIAFFFRHLPTEIVIFINIYYQMKCFIGDRFSFFRSKFCYYSTYFFYFMWSSNKVLKDIKTLSVHSRTFIRYRGKSLNLFWIWCCI